MTPKIRKKMSCDRGEKTISLACEDRFGIIKIENRKVKFRKIDINIAHL